MNISMRLFLIIFQQYILINRLVFISVLHLYQSLRVQLDLCLFFPEKENPLLLLLLLLLPFSTPVFLAMVLSAAGMQSQQISENLVGFLPQENLTFLQQQLPPFLHPCLFYKHTGVSSSFGF